jgi:prevent-host-death family protein
LDSGPCRSILDAKNQLWQLVKRAQAGEEVVIAKRGQPVACLVAASAKPGPGEPGNNGAASLATWLAANPLPAHARRSAADIDAAITRERQAWD